jgi:ABC-type dipeptide/oligopeptide/nickel transport system ATPase component
MTKRGLIIFVGATGSGKSTSLAAMVDYLDPAKIVIGGGLWLGSDLYRSLVLASYEKNVTKRRKAPDVLNSVAGVNSAVIGAAIAAN